MADILELWQSSFLGSGHDETFKLGGTDVQGSAKQHISLRISSMCGHRCAVERRKGEAHVEKADAGLGSRKDGL